MWGTSPLREGRNAVAEDGVVYLIDQDTKEGGSLVVRVGLELGADLDKSRSHSEEQTGLRHGSTHVYLDNAYNIRILGSCSDPLHASGNFYHIPRPPCGKVSRVDHQDLP